MITGIDFFMWDFDDVALRQRLAVLRSEMVRLLFWKEVVVVASEQSVAAMAHDLLCRAVDAHESQIPGVLGKHHGWHVFEERFEQSIGILQLSLKPLALEQVATNARK